MQIAANNSGKLGLYFFLNLICNFKIRTKNVKKSQNVMEKFCKN